MAGAGLAIGLKKLNPDKIVRVSVFSSVFFLASLINVRLGPSSTHLSLLAPVGLVLGWSVFPAVMAALLLQAILLQFGGLLVLGANTTAEMEKIREAAGSERGYQFCYSGGEICPVYTESGELINRFHNCSLIACLL